MFRTFGADLVVFRGDIPSSYSGIVFRGDIPRQHIPYYTVSKESESSALIYVYVCEKKIPRILRAAQLSITHVLNDPELSQK